MGSIACRRKADIDQETVINTLSHQDFFDSAIWKEDDPDSIHNDLLCLQCSDSNQGPRTMRKSFVGFYDTAHEKKKYAA
jgi:hypothetical protein